jgi:hypothetical protein
LESLRTLITEHRVGRTFGEHLLWVALALIALEFSCANILARSATGKTHKSTSTSPSALQPAGPTEPGAYRGGTA